MSLLIDGYNLLHASGVMPSGQGPHTFERAREALLRFLAASLTEEERVRTTIVFDAREAPFNKPRTLDREGMTIRFAPREIDADTLIEELIKADHAPRSLTVVSSDHRIQNAARRRRATAVDSDVWCGELIRKRNEARGAAPASIKPQGPLPPSEVARWMEEFRVEEIDEAEPQDDTDVAPPDPAKYIDTHAPSAPRAAMGSTQKDGPKKSLPKRDLEMEKLPGYMPNPFPPGYGEDVTEEDVE